MKKKSSFEGSENQMTFEDVPVVVEKDCPRCGGSGYCEWCERGRQYKKEHPPKAFSEIMRQMPSKPPEKKKEK